MGFNLELRLHRLLSFIFLVLAPPLAISQTTPPRLMPSTAPPAAVLWRSDKVIYLFGLPEIKPKQSGSLAISPKEIIFSSAKGTTMLQRAEIVSASKGDERIERGGFAGKVVRKLPYGIGPVFTLGLQAHVGLLTIEYRDEHNAYHGVVFMLPKDEGDNAQETLGYPVAKSIIEESQYSCVTGSIRPNTMKVSTLGGETLLLPTEYKILIYERLISRLQSNAGFERIYRDGDNSPSAVCPELKLNMSIKTFNKGNIVLRSSTGPLGAFIGATKLRIHVEVCDSHGATILDKYFKASQKGDSESLDITEQIAKSVVRKLKKANAHRPGASLTP